MYGIGITTMNRPHCLKALVDSIHKHTDMSNVILHIEDDSIDRIGVAKRKNNCLRALKDCSHVFLLDDDVKIIKDGWIEFFIENAQGEHVMFLNPLIHNPFEKNGKFIAHKDCGGVFLFLTKKHIEFVGAFNESFELWGFEHADYSMRIAGDREFLMIEGTEQYIYSEDYSNPNHKSSITNEEKDLLFKKNFPIFAKGIEQIYLPL
jgi:hypothetical protein